MWGPWSPIHILSVFTPVMLVFGVLAARGHRVRAHKITMISIFAGALRARGAVHAGPGTAHAQRLVRPIATAGKGCRRRAVFVLGADSAENVPTAVCTAAARNAAGLVSLWKNEGKNRSRKPVRGGLEAVDTLYEFLAKIDRIPPLSDSENTPPGEPPAPSDIRPVSILDEMKRSYLDYAMSVIVARALPDARDGLKPVHRRILYSMYEQGHTPDKKYIKSARVVGDVIGKYHPHGDQSIYDAMVRMAQDFSMRVPLIDGQGNFGSVDGDPPAAYRYTEARLARSAIAVLGDIDKDTVDFQPNYDSSEKEPSVLPAKFPNLLVNGAGGIAVGMATNIPPHNLGEVIDACVALIDNPALGIDDLINIIPGTGFSDRRHHPRPPGHSLGLSSRPRLDRDARQGVDRYLSARTAKPSSSRKFPTR